MVDFSVTVKAPAFAALTRMKSADRTCYDAGLGFIADMQVLDW